MKRFKILTFLSLSLLVVVLTACPSNSSNNTAPSIGSLTATPDIINEGASSTLDWTVTGSPTPTLSINQGVGPVTGTSTSVTPTTTTTYTLTATNSEGSDSENVTVTVNPAATAPNITSFTASPSSITAGNSSTLSWAVTGSPTSLTINQSVGDVTNVTSTSVTPTTTTTYTLTATNAQGTDTETVTVNVTTAPIAPTIASFTANPSTINEGSSSTLSWNVTGSPTPTLSINQGVGTVTGSSTSVTPTTTTTYTLTATNSEGSTTEDVTVTVTPLTATINGVVVDFNNQPVANVPVVIFGENNGTLSTTALNTQTNADGEFSLSGVKKPYDIAAIFNSAAPPGATVYLSLTREDPRLIFIAGGFTTPKDADFNGTVTATGSAESYPLPANHFDRGVFGSPDVIEDFGINNATGDFNVNVQWFGNQTTTGNIHVLQWEGSSSLPTSFTGYGKRENVVLADSNTANDQDVEITGLGSLNAGGSVNVPAGYTINDKELRVIFDANSRLDIGSDNTPNANFNFITPQINGATLELFVQADDGPRFSSIRKNGFALDNQTITINIPEAPSLSLPVDNAPNVNIGTEFSWSPFGFNQSVYAAQFGSAVSQFIVFTEDTSITIPDLSSIGLPLGPPSTTTTYGWSVFGIGPLNNINAAASQTLFDLFFNEIKADETVQGNSQTFSFDVVMP